MARLDTAARLDSPETRPDRAGAVCENLDKAARQRRHGLGHKGAGLARTTGNKAPGHNNRPCRVSETDVVLAAHRAPDRGLHEAATVVVLGLATAVVLGHSICVAVVLQGQGRQRLP